MALPKTVPNQTGALCTVVRKEIGFEAADRFMTRFSQLTVPIIFSAQQELALALKAYLLWGEVPVIPNHLLAVAFDDLRALADDLMLENQNDQPFNTDFE